MRQVHRAGEKCCVDYAGQTVPVIDPRTGEVRAAQVFVAVLGASHYCYAEATESQALPDWIGSHVRALEYFGGITHRFTTIVALECPGFTAGIKGVRTPPLDDVGWRHSASK